MRVAVVGAGCVGSVVATRIFDSGTSEVGFVASGARGRRLENQGVLVNGRRYRIPVFQAGDLYPDLLIFCVKNYQLRQACDDAAFCVGGGTKILPLLNGVTATSILKDRFPSNDVLYGYISKIDTLAHDGRFDYHVPGDVHFGRRINPAPDDDLGRIASVFESAGFGVSIDCDMVAAIWRKWTLNVGANQVSALTEADYVQFSRIPEISELLRSAMEELVSLARKEGVAIGDSTIDELVEYLTTYQYPKKTSMLQDVLAHRKTEIESISGEVLSLAEKWGQPCPVNETLFRLVLAKEQAYLHPTKERGNDGE